jgi:Domain of unknown function (DUF1996)
VLYYQYPNGSFASVQQLGSATIYYLQRPGSNESIYAFPEGFRMVTGDPFKRNLTTDLAGQAISYACLKYNGAATPEAACFLTSNCPDGLRTQVFFPSCWDGVNLDSEDNMSLVSYPVDSYNYGSCPDNHPVHLVSWFYEIFWKVNAFRGMWYGDSQPFVWSMGNPMGYGLHGDFLNDCDVELLQSAVDQCRNDLGNAEDCAVFTLTPDDVAEQCIVPSWADQPVSGVLGKLPGCNSVQDGPGEVVFGCGCGSAGPSNDTASEAPETSPASLPSAESLVSSSASSIKSTRSSTTASQMRSAASGSTTHVTVSITEVHSITTTCVVAPESPTSYGLSTLASKRYAHARRHIDGQYVYADDLRWRKQVREGWVW